MPLSSRVIKKVDNSLEEVSIKNKTHFQQSKNTAGEIVVDEVKEAQRHASYILSKAHDDVSALIEATSKEMEKIKQEAHEEAYNQGYNEGYSKGEVDAWQKVNEDASGIYDTANDVLKQTKQIEEDIYRDTEEEIVEMCIEMSEKIIAKQLDVNPETIIDIVKDACQQKIEAKQFIIYVSPSEVEIIRDNKKKIASQLDSIAKIQIIADNGIEPGGCYLENEEGYVDATLQAKIENLGFAVRSGSK